MPQWALDAQPPDPPLAALRAPPPGFPPAGWSGNGEITSFPDAGREVAPNATFPGMLKDEAHAPLRRAYYACVLLFFAAPLVRLPGSLLTRTHAHTHTHTHAAQGGALGGHANWHCAGRA